MRNHIRDLVSFPLVSYLLQMTCALFFIPILVSIQLTNEYQVVAEFLMVFIQALTCLQNISLKN